MRMRPSTAPLLVRRTANLTSALVVTVGRVTEIVQLFPDPLSAFALEVTTVPRGGAFLRTTASPSVHRGVKGVALIWVDSSAVTISKLNVCVRGVVLVTSHSFVNT